ncbi:MAG: sulfatase-like hydrolase/transferase, partial [Polyangiaceae bacterium]|nr:sulfatase-like hydrolase/transferase [Polyangiaceae bacterium]
AVDLSRRPSALLDFPAGTKWYFRGSLMLTAALWAAFIWAAAQRRGFERHIAAVLFVVLFTVIQGTQGGFWALFTTYATPDSEAFSRSITQTLVGTLPFHLAVVWFHFAAAAVTALLFLRIARHSIVDAKWPRGLALVLALIVLAGAVYAPASYRRKRTSVAASTPEHLYLAAVKLSYQEQLGLAPNRSLWRPQKRSPLSVPPLSRADVPARNVLFILQESQRPDATCIDYDPECKLSTRASNAAVPQRLPLFNVRANDSATTLSCSTLWTGVLPSAPHRELQSAPTAWGYAKAAGYYTAYMTSQHVIFHNMRLQMQNEPIDLFACATTIDQRADFDVGANDGKLSDWVIDHWDQMPEPFFAVVQYSNQHYPYLHDPNQAIFDVEGLVPKSKEYEDKFYRNVVYLSDIAVGRLLDKVKKSDKGNRTVIVYTADHGEAFGEHGLEGHTFSVHDNEIRVPAWIDAPEGTLTDEELRSIKRARRQYLWHTDFLPTFLDLFGVWDRPELEPFKANMIGTPITRSDRKQIPVPLTNCSWLWECQMANWGVFWGKLKLVGTQGEKKYHCYDVATDPHELRDLGEGRCRELAEIADQIFPRPDITARPFTPLK